MLKHSSLVGAVVVRSFGLGVLALAVLVGLTISAQQQPAQPVTQIKIVPEKPTINDDITVELSGTFPNGCAPTEAAEPIIIREAMRAQVIIYVTNREAFCSDTPTKWELTVPVGKLPDAGLYQVFVLFNMTKYEDPALLLAQKEFDVQAQPKASAQSEQAGQQPAQRAATSLTILVVDRVRSDGTWVTFPDAMEIAISDPGTPAEPKPKNPCSPKKTCRGHSGRVTRPSGDTPGTEVELSIGITDKHTHKFVGCEFGQNVERIDNCTKPPSRPTKETVRFKVTGPNPVFKFLLEQEALPDLAVRIRANVRRYTEMEQVFCDITVLTTVSNLGPGPGGVVAMGRNYNDSKPNIMRYGMGSGESATHVDMLIRLRPGSYLLEAEVESRSVKESNTANNKAREVAICR